MFHALGSGAPTSRQPGEPWPEASSSPSFRARGFATLHNPGDVIGKAFPESGRQIVTHPVDEHELRAGDGRGSRPTAADVTDRVCHTVNHERGHIDFVQA